MDKQIKEYLDKYPAGIIDVFCHLRQMIFDSVSCEPEEVLWARLPSYCVGKSFVRLIPFKDHINIEAQAVILHKEELASYKLTPKGMLQIYLNQDIPSEILKQIFSETLGREVREFCKNVLVTIPVAETHMRQLQEAGPGCKFLFRSGITLSPLERKQLHFEAFTETAPVCQENVDWADVILGNVDENLLHSGEKLKWLQTDSAGVEAYIKPGVLAPGTMLTNATGAYGPAISEHMLAMTLAILKKLELYRDAQHHGQWKSLGSVRSICGSTVLILGLGDTGGAFGRQCKALGAKVIGVRRANTQKPDYADEVYLTSELDVLLPQADIVAVTLPGTEATRNLLDRRRIGLMKPGAVLLNTGRGYIVDTEALCDALECGALGGAGLDVVQPEPLPAGHRLWQIPTAIVTPHISGGWHLKETHTRVINIFIENLKRFLAGEPLKNQVDFATGYRK